MAFGGFMIPNEGDEQILEIEEFPENKKKFRKPPKTTTHQSRAGTASAHPQHHHMQVALNSREGMIHIESSHNFNSAVRHDFNLGGTNLGDDIEIRPLGTFNNSQPSGLRLSQTHTEGKFSIPNIKSTKSKGSNKEKGGIKKLIKIASSRDGI